MTVDICVVNYQTRNLLQRFLDVLHSDAEKYWQPWRLYIADNGSTDDSVEWLKDNKSKYYIERIDYNDNIGYARAANRLASYGAGEYISILNADVWMTTRQISQIIRAFKDQEVSILGPKQRDEEGRITHGGIVGDEEHPRHRGWHQPDPEDKLFKDKIECVTVSGSAYFIRRTAWHTLTQCKIYREIANYAEGAFLPTDHYYEETFCSYHARWHKFKVFYDGSISIGHSWHKSAPVGSMVEHFKKSQKVFREACDRHSIQHD